jgi:hypothetical protein
MQAFSVWFFPVTQYRCTFYNDAMHIRKASLPLLFDSQLTFCVSQPFVLVQSCWSSFLLIGCPAPAASLLYIGEFEVRISCYWREVSEYCRWRPAWTNHVASVTPQEPCYRSSLLPPSFKISLLKLRELELSDDCLMQYCCGLSTQYWNIKIFIQGCKNTV